MEEKIRLTCSVCQAGIRVRAATKAKFAICPKCQARTPIPERTEVPPLEEAAPLPQIEGEAPPVGSDVTQAEPIVDSPEGEIQQLENLPPAGGEAPPMQIEGEAPPLEIQPGAADVPAPEIQPVAAEAPPVEEEAPPAPKKRGATTRGARGRRGGRGRGRRGDGEGGYQPPKKGFNPILIAIPLVVVAAAAAAYFLGMFTPADERINQNAIKWLNAVQKKNMRAVWKSIEKRESDEEQEADRQFVRDYFDQVDGFTLDFTIEQTAQAEGKWVTVLNFNTSGKYKDAEGNEKEINHAIPDHELWWADIGGKLIVVEQSYKPLFERK